MRGCGGLERTGFLPFLLWEGVVLFKELVFEQFLLWEGVVVGYCGHERTDFEQFLFWEGVVVLKEFILNSFYFGRVSWSSKN